MYSTATINNSVVHNCHSCWPSYVSAVLTLVVHIKTPVKCALLAGKVRENHGITFWKTCINTYLHYCHHSLYY